MLKLKFKKNKLVVITGPSAVGKTVLAQELVKWLPLKKVITTTIRQIRLNEKRGIDYHFISSDRFKDLIDKDLLIEFIEFNGNYYGTQRKDMRRPILDGLVPMLVIDPSEALNIQKSNPDALVIFLKPESINILKKRLIKRGGSQDIINSRLIAAKSDMSKESVFAYSLINKEGHLDETVKLTKKIIRQYLGY